jgi:hypothetical protein
MAKILRVLNAVRDYQIGLPLTLTQSIPSLSSQLIQGTENWVLTE